MRRVTERNAGRLTAGVDGEVVLTPEAKARLADRIEHAAEPSLRFLRCPEPPVARLLESTLILRQSSGQPLVDLR